MATEGFIGFYIETRDYAATAGFWKSLGFENLFETDHGSGEWKHPSGGPYVFIAENSDEDHFLETHAILSVADAAQLAPEPPLRYARDFEPQHWGVDEALVLDPDDRIVSLQAPQVDAAHND